MAFVAAHQLSSMLRRDDFPRDLNGCHQKRRPHCRILVRQLPQIETIDLSRFDTTSKQKQEGREESSRIANNSANLPKIPVRQCPIDYRHRTEHSKLKFLKDLERSQRMSADPNHED